MDLFAFITSCGREGIEEEEGTAIMGPMAQAFLLDYADKHAKSVCHQPAQRAVT